MNFFQTLLTDSWEFTEFHKFEKVENPLCQPSPIEHYRHASSLRTDSILMVSFKIVGIV